ncbi:hypothetical protein F2P81_004039 [Scophthalmus maximus]|uniref:Uncharacterized protein n=1 Tax=Scophthalmus maximus TaxID=52904 RepID=A0A6A4TKZ0_SCOMX|nr:hypothetical protein F2P81_004039 [Scophthalmus maximus]
MCHRRTTRVTCGQVTCSDQTERGEQLYAQHLNAARRSPAPHRTASSPPERHIPLLLCSLRAPRRVQEETQDEDEDQDQDQDQDPSRSRGEDVPAAGAGACPPERVDPDVECDAAV